MKKNMARLGFKPTINQSIANSLNYWTAKLINRYIISKFEIMKNKRNKKLNKNVMKEGLNSANCPAKANQL